MPSSQWGSRDEVSYAILHDAFIEESGKMAEGTIKRLTEKDFGFIDTGGRKDLFFRSSNVVGVRYDDLQEGQRVTFTEAMGQKGPCAENVAPA